MHNSIRNRAVQAIWRFGCVLLLLALSFAGSAAPVNAAPVVFDNFTIPVSMRVFNPCAADGAGEYINLTGNLHLIFFEIHDKAGGVIQKAHANPQGLSGTGETTGVVYRGTGMTQTISLVKKGASITTAIDNQRFIGPGPGNNFLLHTNLHLTTNANGQVTAEVTHSSLICR